MRLLLGAHGSIRLADLPPWYASRARASEVQQLGWQASNGASLAATLQHQGRVEKQRRQQPPDRLERMFPPWPAASGAQTATRHKQPDRRLSEAGEHGSSPGGGAHAGFRSLLHSTVGLRAASAGRGHGAGAAGAVACAGWRWCWVGWLTGCGTRRAKAKGLRRSWAAAWRDAGPTSPAARATAAAGPPHHRYSR